MPLDDLNLEFEDEDDFKKKKNDAVAVDVDLVFQSQEVSPKPRPQSPPSSGTGNVRPFPNRPASQAPSAAATPSTGATAIRVAPPKDATAPQNDLLEQVRKIEFEAEVKVRVADFKAEILGEVIGDMKFMEYQIGQLLARINTKHPDTKQEVLMIKKILADFTAKKRK